MYIMFVVIVSVLYLIMRCFIGFLSLQPSRKGRLSETCKALRSPWCESTSARKSWTRSSPFDSFETYWNMFFGFVTMVTGCDWWPNPSVVASPPPIAQNAPCVEATRPTAGPGRNPPVMKRFIVHVQYIQKLGSRQTSWKLHHAFPSFRIFESTFSVDRSINLSMDFSEISNEWISKISLISLNGFEMIWSWSWFFTNGDVACAGAASASAAAGAAATPATCARAVRSSYPRSDTGEKSRCHSVKCWNMEVS